MPYLKKKSAILEDALRGAVDHPHLEGPDILEEAADMLEEKTITLASQLRKTAEMQRDALEFIRSLDRDEQIVKGNFEGPKVVYVKDGECDE